MTKPESKSIRRFGGPAAVGLLLGTIAGLMVLATLGAPGITIDEPIDAKVATNYINAAAKLAARGVATIGRDDLDALFRDNAQHPPLGRWLLGLATLAAPLEPLLGGVDPFSVHSARLAPMLAFATLVGLIAAFTARRFGVAAGIGAGVSLILMPRSFAHAHLASLDTFLSLFWTAALLAADAALRSGNARRWLPLAGVAWGLALLTKIHAVLLPPLVLLDALLRPRESARRRAVGLTLWTFAGLGVFLAGWPWLWFDSVDRLTAYLSTSTERLSLSVLYFGRVYADHDAPWHYPWVYFALVVPIGLHLLAAVGLASAWRMRRHDPLPLVLAASIVEFLALFSTRAPVYDGERLFLHVFPAWAIMAGLGFDDLWQRARRRWQRVGLAVFLAAQGYGLITTFPCGLSYYNGLVGGLSGATRRGLEPTYWGDSLTSGFMRRVAEIVEPNAVIAVAPSLHHLYPPALMTESLSRKHATLVPQEQVAQADWLIVFRREPYLNNTIRRLADRPAQATVTRQGTWLAKLVKLR